MKNLKLLSLALGIVSTSLFASNSIKVDFITKSIQPVPEIVIVVTTYLEQDINQNFELKFNDEGIFIPENFNKVKNELVIQKLKNNAKFKNQAARNYSYKLRSEIISKE